MLDVDRRDDGVTSAELLARGSFDPDAASLFQYQALHSLIGQDSAALRFHDATQRVGQAAGAALWNSPAVALATRYERVGQRSRARTLGWLQRAFREPDHPRFDMPVLERGIDDVPCGES